MRPSVLTGMTLCRYQTETNHKLIVQRQLTRGSQLTSLDKQLRSLPKMKPGVFNCPADFGPSAAIFAAYPKYPRVEILVDESGCASVTTGHVSPTMTQALIRQLGRLLPQPEQ
jgi:hypothetical protein